jgi:hypothetical protein
MLENGILDEKEGDINELQSQLSIKRRWWRKYTAGFLLAFGVSFFLLLFILYRFTPDDLKRIVGDRANGRYLAVGLLIFAAVCALSSAVFLLRTLLLPFDYDLKQAECRNRLARSAYFYLIFVLAVGIIPILLYFSTTVEDVGDFIGFKPVRSGREFAFVAFTACCIWGAYFLILTIMQALRALSYRQKTTEI